MLVAGALALAACGGSSNKSGAGDSSSTSAGGAGATTPVDPSAATTTGGAQPGPAIGKIRIANLITVNGKPGPALDAYDSNKPASTDTALVKNLQYGQVSDYVTPHGEGAGAPTSNLYLFPAGTLTPSQLFNGSNLDNSGFQDGDQMTVMLFASSSGEAGGPASIDIAEAGSRVNTYVVPNPPAGQGLLIVRDADAQTEGAPGHFLLVDGTCPSPVGQTGDTPVVLGSSSFGLTPGSHTLTVATSPQGQGLTTCTGKAASGKTTVTVTAGQRVEAFVYGDPSAPLVVTAPVT
jgi:hypothetical protein